MVFWRFDVQLDWCCQTLDYSHTTRLTRNLWYTTTTTTIGSNIHRRSSSVNFGGQDIFARKYMHEKLTKWPIFIWWLPEKYFPRFGGGGHVPPLPLSYACGTIVLSKSGVNDFSFEKIVPWYVKRRNKQVSQHLECVAMPSMVVAQRVVETPVPL